MIFDFGPLSDIRYKVEAGERLSFEDGVRLYQTNDVTSLGELATTVRRYSFKGDTRRSG